MEEQIPPIVEGPEKKNNTTLIIVVVVVVLLCCCCVGAYVAWTYGDAILQNLNF
jgi:hypothetical protein